MNVTVKGHDKVISRLDRLGLRVRFAQIKTVNEVAEGCCNVIQRDAEATFKGGITPYVKRGIRFQSAQVEPQGVRGAVFLSDAEGPKGQLSALDILRPHIRGGGRSRKNSERGAVRPWYLVPTKNVPLDARGNVPPSYMKNILSAAGLLGGSGARQNQTAASRRRGGSHGKPLTRGVYVVPGVGIFQHQASLGNSGRRWATKAGGPSVPLFFFVTRPQYEAGTFDFYWVGRTYVRKNLPTALKKHLRIELKR